MTADETDDIDSFLDQLLATPRHAERQALLKVWFIQHDDQLLAFFETVKARSLAIKNDCHQQKHLARILDIALSLTSDLACRAMGFWGKSLTAVYCQQLDKAENFARQSMAYYQQSDNLEAYGTVGANLVMVLVFAGKLAEANDLAQEIELSLRDKEAPVALARLHRHWAMVKSDLQQPNDALSLMKKSFPFIKQSGDPWRIAAYHGDIAPIYLMLDQYVEASQNMEKAVAYFRQDVSKRLDWATTAYRLADIYRKMGRFGEALQMADEAVTAYREAESHDLTYARAVVRQADILIELNQHALALRQLQSIRHLWQKDVNETAEATLLEGITLAALGHHAAENHLRWCIEQFINTFRYYGFTARFVLAQFYFSRGQSSRDPAYWQKGITIAHQLHDELVATHPIRAVEVKQLLIHLALAIEQLDQAQRWLEEMPSLVKTLPHLYGQHHYLLGQLAHQAGDWTAARSHYERALTQINQIRTQFYLENLQTGVMFGKEKLYRALTEVCWAQADWAGLWRHSELARAYSLTASLSRETLIIPISESNASENSSQRLLVKKLYNTRAQRFSLCSQLYEQPTTNDVGQSFADEATKRQQIRKLDTEINVLYEQLANQSAISLGSQFSAPFSPIDEVAAYLPEGTLLLVYGRLTTQLFALGIDKTGLVIQQKLPASWVEVKRPLSRFLYTGLQKLHDAARSYGTDYLQKHYPRFIAEAQQQLHQLYQTLWHPLATALTPYPNIIIAPQDTLHYVPFASLHTGKDYLIDHHTISYTPSASIHVLCQQRALARHQNWGQNIVLLAYEGHQGDLNGVYDEVQRIQETYPNSKLLEGTQATLSRLRAYAPTTRILHLATHGRMSHFNPFLSHLELAPDLEGKNGQLRVYDAAQLDLRQTDLVCLSACETGQVTDSGGDLLGLQWGFFHAGAYALLANQWLVDDEGTARLMGNFYRHYQPERGKAIALRAAQLALRQFGEARQVEDSWRFAHPYFWGPFALYGFAAPIS